MVLGNHIKHRSIMIHPRGKREKPFPSFGGSLHSALILLLHLFYCVQDIVQRVMAANPVAFVLVICELVLKKLDSCDICPRGQIGGTAEWSVPALEEKR